MLELKTRARVQCHHVKGHAGVIGNEMADVAASFSLYEGLAFPGNVYACLKAFGPPPPSQRPFALESVLFWGEWLNWTGPQVVDKHVGKERKVILASANVRTMHPKEMGDSEKGGGSVSKAPSFGPELRC